MRRALALLAALFVAGCGGSSGTTTSGSHGGTSVRTVKPTAPERKPAVPAVLGVASRYVDARVAGGKLPPVHVGRAGVLGKVALVYLIGGSDVAGGGGGEPIKGLYGVLVVANRGGKWRVAPPVVALGGHS